MNITINRDRKILKDTDTGRDICSYGSLPLDNVLFTLADRGICFVSAEEDKYYEHSLYAYDIGKDRFRKLMKYEGGIKMKRQGITSSYFVFSTELHGSYDSFKRSAIYAYGIKTGRLISCPANIPIKDIDAAPGFGSNVFLVSGPVSTGAFLSEGVRIMFGEVKNNEIHTGVPVSVGSRMIIPLTFVGRKGYVITDENIVIASKTKGEIDIKTVSIKGMPFDIMDLFSGKNLSDIRFTKKTVTITLADWRTGEETVVVKKTTVDRGDVFYRR